MYRIEAFNSVPLAWNPTKFEDLIGRAVIGLSLNPTERAALKSLLQRKCYFVIFLFNDEVAGTLVMVNETMGALIAPTYPETDWLLQQAKERLSRFGVTLQFVFADLRKVL